MNLALVNPFAQSYPENFDSSIESSALCARFNPSGIFAGHFLAVGRVDGSVAVLDFETKGIVRWLEGHVKAVTTLCWSQNSRYLLTASRDWNAIIWDLSSECWDTPEGERRHTVRFDAPVTSAHLHPQNSYMLVATLHGQVQPVFVDLRQSVGGRWELEVDNSPEEQPGDEEDADEIKKNKETATICRFNPTGDLIYVGTSKGNIRIWDVMTKEHLWCEATGSNSTIKHMEFNEKGTAMVLNANDRCIRVIHLLKTPPANEGPEDEGTKESEDGQDDVKMEEEEEEAASPEPDRPERIPYFDEQHKFQDPVGRAPWNGCGFSADGEHIIGGAGHKAAHNIYIWESDSGRLSKILEGPKDPLEDLDWHPIRPVIASVSSIGLIHIWTTGITENWSAYAPGFEELDENMEYPEKEDEFDIEDESAVKRRKAGEQDRPVDILTAPISRPPPLQLEAVPQSYEEFCAIQPDDDFDEAFYPPPELDELYEVEEPVPPLFPTKKKEDEDGAGGGGGEDEGNVSEELGVWDAGQEEKKSKAKRKR